MNKLYAIKQWGSAITELAFQLTGFPYQAEYMDEKKRKEDSYLQINPLHQVPALLLPNGELMTESLAICTYAVEHQGAKGRPSLIPEPGSAVRSKYLRWSTFIVAAFYPTCTYGDDLPRWAGPEISAQNHLDSEIKTYKKTLVLQLEAAATAKGNWFLPGDMTLIDVYLAIMYFWQPGPVWYQANAPKLMAIIERMHATEEFKLVYAANS